MPVAGYEISADPARLDRGLIHDFLSTEAYWARGVPRDVVERCIDNSICFGVYRGGEQVGFARVVTDRAAIPISPTCSWSRSTVAGASASGSWRR